MKHRTKAAILALAAVPALTFAGCATDTDADVASANLSKAADQFEIDRRIVFVNGITDKYLLSIEGKCAIHDDGNQLEVTCMTGPNEYTKHFLGLSNNVTYVSEHLTGTSVSTNHYRVIYKPEAIIPNFDRP